MSERSSAPKTPPAKEAPVSKEDAAAASRREQLYAARRASAANVGGAESRRPRGTQSQAPISPRPERIEDEADEAPKASVAPKRSSPAILGAGALVGVGVLIAAIVFGAGEVRRGTPSGKLRHALLFADVQAPIGAQREVAFAAIDVGPEGPRLALQLLADVEHASEDSTRSARTYRELAADFLLAYAGKIKAPAPAAATALAAKIRSGQAPNDAEWGAVREAWTAWLAEPAHAPK